MFKNSNMKGNYAMGIAVQHYTALGAIVSIPITDSQEYDLVVDMGSGLKKVQVKFTGRKRGTKWYIDLRTNDGRDLKKNTIGLVDIVFVVDMDSGIHIYCAQDMAGKTGITLHTVAVL